MRRDEDAQIGIDLGGTKIEAILIDAAGAVAARRRIPTPAGDYEGTVAAVAGLVEELRAHGDGDATVGIGTPGAISAATGRIKNANSTMLNGRALVVDLERAIGKPIRVANDANCFALSEAVDGAAAAARVVFGVIIGTGTGGGVVVEREVIPGRNAVAGEWGHLPLPWPRDDERPGPACYCGRFGCLERWISGPAFERDYAEGGGTRLRGAEIAARAAAGEEAALAALERYVDRLARGLAIVVDVLDPDAIVLGGGMSNVTALYERVPERLGRYAFTDVLTTPILPAMHGDSSGVRGAAWLWRS